MRTRELLALLRKKAKRGEPFATFRVKWKFDFSEKRKKEKRRFIKTYHVSYLGYDWWETAKYNKEEIEKMLNIK